MDFEDEVNNWLDDYRRGYLTPYEKSVILARMQNKQFPSLEACLIWCRNTAIEIIETNNHKVKYKSDTESIYE